MFFKNLFWFNFVFKFVSWLNVFGFVDCIKILDFIVLLENFMIYLLRVLYFIFIRCSYYSKNKIDEIKLVK